MARFLPAGCMGNEHRLCAGREDAIRRMPGSHNDSGQTRKHKVGSRLLEESHHALPSLYSFAVHHLRPHARALGVYIGRLRRGLLPTDAECNAAYLAAAADLHELEFLTRELDQQAGKDVSHSTTPDQYTRQ